MKYRVQLLRVARQAGYIDVHADSRRDAVALAIELATSPSELIRKPEWGEQIAKGHIVATDVVAA